ncbi:MAG: helix-turn-helix domain-containing protein, partial [bacterium]|nr:helix-turn-helix domain-containing protein [bacterium]
MDSIFQNFEKNLITTKDAGKLSGYTPDYLSRLIRSGKITGKKIGHSWLIDNESLTRFVDQQGIHKSNYARELTSAREAEYNAHLARNGGARTDAPRLDPALDSLSQIPPPKSSENIIRHIGRRMSDMSNVSDINIGESSLFSHAVALSVALAVVTSGALAASAVLPHFADKARMVVSEAASGFNEIFGDIPSSIASKINSVSDNLSTYPARVIARMQPASEEIAPMILAPIDISTLHRFASWRGDEYRASSNLTNVLTAVSPTKTPALTLTDIKTFALDAYTLLTHPSRIVDVFIRAYVASGVRAYAAIEASFIAYHSLIEKSGIKTLALAEAARSLAALAPGFIWDMNLALGSSIIDATHTLIRADVRAIYGAASGLASVAAAPAAALSAGEQVALAFYETTNHFFGSVSRTLATLFDSAHNVFTMLSDSVKRTLATFFDSTPPTTGAPGPAIAVATSTTSQTVNSYPTYTTIVQGVSPDLLNQSLAALRLDVFSAIAASGGTGHFSDARSGGVFNGGIFDKGSLTNGVSVSATTGNFDSLTAGDTIISGTLTTSGTLSSDTSATAPYCAATDSLATSTFAGHFAVGTSTPYGDGIFT